MSESYKPKLPDTAVQALVTEICNSHKAAWEADVERATHYHRTDPGPKLPPQYAEAVKYQSDELRKVSTKLRARLTENDHTVRVESAKASGKSAANNLETVLMEAKTIISERTGINPQKALAECVQQRLAIIHWCKAEDIWPEVDEADYLTEAPEDEDRDNYAPMYRDDDEGEDAESVFQYRKLPDGGLDLDDNGDPKPRKVARWRETESALKTRMTRSRAEAGFPLYWEVIPPMNWAGIEDRSLANGYAACIVRRDTPRIDYRDNLAKERIDAGEDEEEVIASINQLFPDVPIYGEQPGPAAHEPGHGDRAEVMRVYQLWTRDECYEIDGGDASSDGLTEPNEMRIMKAYSHPYGMPPFAVAWSVKNHSTYAPELRHECALEGLYRLKPAMDRARTLQHALAEMTALPLYYWARAETGEPLLKADGTPRYLTRDAVDADVAPPGYELKKLEYEINPAFLDSVKDIRDEFIASAPSVGTAEFTASTQPWAIRLQQAQANIEPGMYIRNIADALTVMYRNIAMLLSLEPEAGGFTEPPAVFARTTDGKLDRSSTISVNPKDVRSLNVSVAIEATSAAERITKEAHGREMLMAKVLTMSDYLEDYQGISNPEEKLVELFAEEQFNTTFKPLVERRVMAELGYLMGPNGMPIDQQGNQVDPRQVLAANGYQQVQQQPQPGGGGFQPGAESQPQTRMGGLADLNTPGTMPMRGTHTPMGTG